jgi:hypothetical protein
MRDAANLATRRGLPEDEHVAAAGRLRLDEVLLS